MGQERVLARRDHREAVGELGEHQLDQQQRPDVAEGEQADPDGRGPGGAAGHVGPGPQDQRRDEQADRGGDGQVHRLGGRDAGEALDRGRPQVVRPVVVQRLPGEVRVFRRQAPGQLGGHGHVVHVVPVEVRDERVAPGRRPPDPPVRDRDGQQQGRQQPRDPAGLAGVRLAPGRQRGPPEAGDGGRRPGEQRGQGEHDPQRPRPEHEPAGGQAEAAQRQPEGGPEDDRREARLVVRQRPADEDHPGERHRQKGRQADRNADRREAGGVAERDE